MKTYTIGRTSVCSTRYFVLAEGTIIETCPTKKHAEDIVQKLYLAEIDRQNRMMESAWIIPITNRYQTIH